LHFRPGGRRKNPRVTSTSTEIEVCQVVAPYILRTITTADVWTI